MENSLDVRKTIENDADLQQMLTFFMNDKRYFLFKHQNRRFLTPSDDFDDRDIPSKKIKFL